jgi:hypothetical protein
MRRFVKPRPCRPASAGTARLSAPLRTMANEAGARIRNRWLEGEQELQGRVQASLRAPASPGRFPRLPRRRTARPVLDHRPFQDSHQHLPPHLPPHLSRKARREPGDRRPKTGRKGRRRRRSWGWMSPHGDSPRSRHTEVRVFLPRLWVLGLSRNPRKWTDPTKQPEWLCPRLPDGNEIRSRFDVTKGRRREMRRFRSIGSKRLGIC